VVVVRLRRGWRIFFGRIVQDRLTHGLGSRRGSHALTPQGLGSLGNKRAEPSPSVFAIIMKMPPDGIVQRV
jgi:hypothetical protein